MVIQHTDALSIENIVSGVFKCNRYDVGGFVDADIFGRDPMCAVALCVAKLYNGQHDDEIADFARKWRIVFNYPEDNQEYIIEDFIDEFRAIVRLLKNE